jgi:hypothetical protein
MIRKNSTRTIREKEREVEIRKFFESRVHDKIEEFEEQLRLERYKREIKEENNKNDVSNS